jgi:hypothetical protein
VSDVADAVVRVVCPDTPRVPPTPRRNAGDVDPIPTLPLEPILKRAVFEEEATVKSAAVGADDVPCTVKSDVGVEDPTPTFPLAKILKKEVPDEDATRNGSRAGDACRLKVTVDDVAFTPDTVPLSRRRPDESVEAPVQRARKPGVPPERDVIPRDEVATHRVDVPVERRTCPRVPEAVVESRSVPTTERLPVA